jgi:hypothetical protein
MVHTQELALFLTHNSGNDYTAPPKKIYRKVEEVEKVKEGKEKRGKRQISRKEWLKRLKF